MIVTPTDLVIMLDHLVFNLYLYNAYIIICSYNFVTVTKKNQLISILLNYWPKNIDICF